MREYAKVAPQFWTGKTGKALKAAGPEAVIVGLYLMTSPHANMIGVYHCPMAYIAFDTGLGLEGAAKGLQSAIDAGFCTYEADSDYVFVHEFATYQIGEELDARDNRVKGIKNELDKVPKGQCWQAFRARYATPFHLPFVAAKTSPSEAPLKPGAGAGAGAGEEAGAETGAGDSAAAKGSPTPPPSPPPPPPAADASATKGKRIGADWALPRTWGEWTLAKYPHWTDAIVRDLATGFHNHWKAKAGRDGVKLDWYATWQNWCMSEITQRQHPAPKGGDNPADAEARRAQRLAEARALIEARGRVPSAAAAPAPALADPNVIDA